MGLSSDVPLPHREHDHYILQREIEPLTPRGEGIRVQATQGVNELISGMVGASLNMAC